MRVPFVFCLVLLWVPSLPAQHGRYLSDSRNPAIGDPGAIAAGSKLYATSCAGCHGPDGSGGRGPNLVRRVLWHPLGDDDIFRTIRNGVPGADMPPTKLSDEQTWNLVAFLHALMGPASENSAPGNPQAGEQVFWGGKAGCSNCHSIRGRGGRMGPDLTDIGGSRPLALIRDAIVKRTRTLFLLGNEAVSVTLKDGQKIEGIARNRSNFSLQVVDQEGNLHLLAMTDVKSLKISDRSAMPADYGERLSKRELEDLLAYMARQVLRAGNN